MVSSTLRPHFIPGKDPVPILQEAGWAPGPIWMGGKSLTHRDSILDRPARSQSLYRLISLAHFSKYSVSKFPPPPLSSSVFFLTLTLMSFSRCINILLSFFPPNCLYVAVGYTSSTIRRCLNFDDGLSQREHLDCRISLNSR